VAEKANCRFSYISVIDEASDFKFGTQLEFAKPVIKSHQKKVDVALG